jgi:hypothetical protein
MRSFEDGKCAYIHLVKVSRLDVWTGAAVNVQSGQDISCDVFALGP